MLAGFLDTADYADAYALPNEWTAFLNEDVAALLYDDPPRAQTRRSLLGAGDNP